MTIVATTILPRDADNTITLETNYNDLNLKATTLAEDLVAFVEAAISDVDTAATAIDGTMRMTLAATKEQADIVATSASLVLPKPRQYHRRHGRSWQRRGYLPDSQSACRIYRAAGIYRARSR